MFFGGNKPEYYGVLHIRSGSVYTAFIEVPVEGGSATVCAEDEISLNLPAQCDPKRFCVGLGGIQKQIERFFLREGMEKLRSRAPHAGVSNVILSFGAPWSRVISRSVSYEREKPFEITNTMLLDLAEQAEQKTEQELKENDASAQIGFALGERTVVQKTVNGYPVKHLLGAHGNSITLTHIHNLLVKDVADSAAEIMSGIFPNAQQKLYSHLFILYKALHGVYPYAHSYCLVDVTEQATEIAVINDGVVRYVTHVPYGGSLIASAVGENLGTPKADAESKTRALCEKMLSDRKGTPVDAALHACQTSFKKAVHNLYENYYIPQTIFISALSGDGEALTEEVTTIFAEAGNETHRVIDLTRELPPSLVFINFLAHGDGEKTEFVTK